mgnify:CR=1 FL=1
MYTPFLKCAQLQLVDKPHSEILPNNLINLSSIKGFVKIKEIQKYYLRED